MKILITVLILSLFNGLTADITQLRYSAFKFSHELRLPGNPDTIYDTVTGDISPWWDHSFSENPIRFYIEPKPGGGFYEIINKQGDGILHATVIAANRGKLLRFDGPLGLAGRAVQLVHTYTFTPFGADSTQLRVEVHGSGEIEEGLPAAVENVWHHFLFTRLKPYLESNKKSKQD